MPASIKARLVALNWHLVRQLIRRGLRQLGMPPTSVVFIAIEGWDAHAVSRGATRAVKATPDTPPDIYVAVPTEGHETLHCELEALAASAVTVAPEPLQPTESPQ